MTDDHPQGRSDRRADVVGALSTFGIEAALVVAMGALGFLIAVVMLALV